MEIFELALFIGSGGGTLGGELLGWQCIGGVECEEFPSGTVAQRQNDGIISPFPIWDDVKTFSIENPDTREFIEFLRSIRSQLVISGGFPCQDISVAGRGDGLEGERSSLWFEFKRIIGEIRPRLAWVENSPMLTLRGGTRVVADLTEMGYRSRWGIVSASNAMAPHGRKRFWLLAYTDIG